MHFLPHKGMTDQRRIMCVTQTDIHDPSIMSSIPHSMLLSPYTATLLCLLINSFSPTLFSLLSLPLTLFSILILGIPHGALDHILYYNLLKARSRDQKSTDHVITPMHIFQFYSNYLIIMLLWASSWFLFPDIAFWAFLAVSCFHFGEGDLDYLTGLGKNFKYMLYMSRGIFIVGLTLVSQPAVTLPIVQHLIVMGDEEFKLICEIGFPVVIIQHYVVLYRLGLMCVFVRKQGANAGAEPFPSKTESIMWSPFLKESLKSLLYLVMFSTIDPLTSFSLYFGFWHSSTTIYHTILFLKTDQTKESAHIDQTLSWSDIKSFYYKSAPYTLISYVFLTVMIAIYYAYFNDLSSTADFEICKIWAIFIGFISVLTGDLSVS